MLRSVVLMMLCTLVSYMVDVAYHPEWNITVSHRSLTDQLVFMTDHNFGLIGHPYLHDWSSCNSYCMDGWESIRDQTSRQLREAAGKI